MKKSTSKVKSEKKTNGFPLAVISFSDRVYLFERIDKKTTSSLSLSISFNGVDFIEQKNKVKIEVSPKKSEKIKLCDRFSLSKTPNGYVMTYVRHGDLKKKSVIVL